jgi:hypothetical protein
MHVPSPTPLPLRRPSVPTSARSRSGRGVPDSVGELRDEIVEQPLAFGVERRHRLLEDVRRRHNLRGGVGQPDAADPRLDLLLAAKPRTSVRCIHRRSEPRTSARVERAALRTANATATSAAWRFTR